MWPSHVLVQAEEALERTINRPSPQMDSDRLARLREKAERGRRLLRQLEDRARELEEAKERRARQERERLRNGGPSPCAEGTGAPSGSAGSGAGHAFPDAHPAQRLADF